MENREQQLCLVEAETMERVAQEADAQARRTQKPVVREVLTKTSTWLRTEAERIRRWSSRISGKLPLGRLRLVPLKVEKLVRDIVRRGDHRAEEATRPLIDYLEVQENRGLYEEMAQTLRALVSYEEHQGDDRMAKIHRDLVQKLERRLDSGECDRPAPEDRSRDEAVLERLRAQLAELEGRL